jgi:hypothetical protein
MVALPRLVLIIPLAPGDTELRLRLGDQFL